MERAALRLHKDSRLLMAAIEAGNIDLALATAKRVRRTSTLLVKDIANTRDQLHAQEGDKP